MSAAGDGSGGRAPLRRAEDAELHPSLPQPDEPSFLRAGATTADAVAGKPVTLTVQVPKALRRSVRDEAERRGVPVDRVVAEALRDRTPRG